LGGSRKFNQQKLDAYQAMFAIGVKCGIKFFDEVNEPRQRRTDNKIVMRAKNGYERSGPTKEHIEWSDNRLEHSVLSTQVANELRKLNCVIALSLKEFSTPRTPLRDAKKHFESFLDLLAASGKEGVTADLVKINLDKVNHCLEEFAKSGGDYADAISTYKRQWANLASAFERWDLIEGATTDQYKDYLREKEQTKNLKKFKNSVILSEKWINDLTGNEKKVFLDGFRGHMLETKSTLGILLELNRDNISTEMIAVIDDINYNTNVKVDVKARRALTEAVIRLIIKQYLINRPANENIYIVGSVKNTVFPVNKFNVSNEALDTLVGTALGATKFIIQKNSQGDFFIYDSSVENNSEDS
jgi:hypothetical protein